MKRQKRITRRERKALSGAAQPQATSSAPRHIHCIACGRHIEPAEFTTPPLSATWITCQHGSTFPSCVTCSVQSQTLVDAHDRTGQPVRTANAWH